MKLYYLIMVLISSLQADWKSDMLQKSNELYNETKDKTILLYRENLEIKPLSKIERMNRVWDNVYNDLEESAKYIDKYKNAPDSSWIDEDKKDIQEDINKMFEMIINGLIEDDILIYKTKIASLKEKISHTVDYILQNQIMIQKLLKPKMKTIYLKMKLQL